MKKIIFCNIPMVQRASAFVYNSDGNAMVSTEPVQYVVNAIIGAQLASGDSVKVVSLMTEDDGGICQHNNELFVQEFARVTSGKDIHVEYASVSVPFSEHSSAQEQLFRRAVGQLEDNADIYFDMTFGPKSLPIIAFATLNFAEKFFQCNVRNIVYSKAEFVGGKVVSAQLCDMTTLYYLNKITNTIDCHNSNDALLILDSMLDI